MIAANQLNNYCPYEIGDIYLTLRDENPSNRWGGTTWERIKDRFLLAAGDSYAVGGTGGEASHTLSVNEMPSHRHAIQHYYGTGSGGTGYVPANSVARSVAVRTDVNGIADTGGTFTDRPSGNYIDTGLLSNTGSSSAHNNMPPYLTVHMWKRIS